MHLILTQLRMCVHTHSNKHFNGSASTAVEMSNKGKEHHSYMSGNSLLNSISAVHFLSQSVKPLSNLTS